MLVRMFVVISTASYWGGIGLGIMFGFSIWLFCNYLLPECLDRKRNLKKSRA